MLPNYCTLPFAHGQIQSKLWLLNSLKRKSFDQIYILGSWIGVTGFLLHACNFKFNKLICVDIDKEALDYANFYLDVIRCQSKLELINSDCNNILFSGTDNLIVNTSVENMLEHSWYNNVPKNTLLALQARTGGHYDNIYPIESMEIFDKMFPMQKVEFLDTFEFIYPELSYTRFMKIGFK